MFAVHPGLDEGHMRIIATRVEEVVSEATL
jgi:hypothetical protein